MLRIGIIVLIFGAVCVCAVQSNRPNIVYILADDLGYSDIGYNARLHNSSMLTPFLDELAEKGVKLKNYYVQSSCSPSRSQLMSGRYQIRTGLQHDVISAAQRNGLPLDNKIIPEQLRSCGYDTHMVGKWHLGFYKKEYMPLNRGFNSFFGFLNAGADHYAHAYSNTLDMWDNNKPTEEYTGKYSTHLFTEKSIKAIDKRDKSKPFFLYLSHQAVHTPMQVPENYLKTFMHIKDETRRIYAGMLLALDESVKNVLEHLEKSGMLNNTIFIFSSDNGGAPRYGGNNWPLRGRKKGLWEGGVKSVGFVSGQPLGISGVESYNFMHISDWLPTLLGAAGCPKLNDTPPLDGFDQWNAILQKEESPRQELLHGMDPLRKTKFRGFAHGFDLSTHAALRSGPWKLLTGPSRTPSRVPPPETGWNTDEYKIDWRQNVQLYHIETDPYEKHDLSKEYADVVSSLTRKLAAYSRSAVPVRYPPPDPKAHAKRKGRGFWGPWLN